MKVKLYLDEDSMDQALVHGLRARGVDVLTALEAGMIKRRDELHLEYATDMERTLCSFNVRDFATLHAQWLASGRHHAGMVLSFQQRLQRSEQLRRLLRFVGSLTAAQMLDRLEYLSNWS